MRIAVAGGTGVVGRRVVETLTQQGHEPVVLARSLGVDVATGAGLSDALAGATAVIDVSNAATLRRRTSVQFFTNSSTNLLAAGERAGVQHHVALSIVGIDRVDTGYYAGKRRQEDVVLAGPLPASVLRATQFHEFAGQLLSRTPGRFAPSWRPERRPAAPRTWAAPRSISWSTWPAGCCRHEASSGGSCRCACRAPQHGRCASAACSPARGRSWAPRPSTSGSLRRSRSADRRPSAHGAPPSFSSSLAVHRTRTPGCSCTRTHGRSRTRNAGVP